MAIFYMKNVSFEVLKGNECTKKKRGANKEKFVSLYRN